MCVVASWTNALIVLWRGGDSFDHVERAASCLSERFPSGIGVLGISTGEVQLEGAAERQRVGERLSRRGVNMLGVASVIEDDSAARQVIDRINLVTAHPCPIGVFDTVDEAVFWLAPRLGPMSSRELRHAVTKVRKIGPTARVG